MRRGKKIPQMKGFQRLRNRTILFQGPQKLNSFLSSFPLKGFASEKCGKRKTAVWNNSPNEHQLTGHSCFWLLAVVSMATAFPNVASARPASSQQQIPFMRLWNASPCLLLGGGTTSKQTDDFRSDALQLWTRFLQQRNSAIYRISLLFFYSHISSLRFFFRA